MEKEVIKNKGEELVVVIRRGDFPEGLKFYTGEGKFVQVATWNHPKGNRSIPHAHKEAERTATKTQEVVYVKSGKLKAEIYDDEGNFIDSTEMGEGDIAIIFSGGHSFTTLTDNTQVLEVKNGPYLGEEKDKKVLE